MELTICLENARKHIIYLSTRYIISSCWNPSKGSISKARHFTHNFTTDRIWEKIHHLITDAADHLHVYLPQIEKNKL